VPARLLQQYCTASLQMRGKGLKLSSFQRCLLKLILPRQYPANCCHGGEWRPAGLLLCVFFICVPGYQLYRISAAKLSKMESCLVCGGIPARSFFTSHGRFAYLSLRVSKLNCIFDRCTTTVKPDQTTTNFLV